VVFNPTWVVGSGWLAPCGRSTTVFGVVVCVTPGAWATSIPRCNHIAHVLAQLLDNDADGQPDAPELTSLKNALFNLLRVWWQP